MISAVLLYACKPGIPKEIIQPDQMGKLLFDINVVDGYITTITNRDSAKLVAAAYYKGIYKKFGVDSALYAKSMDYYYAHPDIMEKIYTAVEKTFVKEKARNDKVIAADEALELAKANAKNVSYLNVKEAVPTSESFKMVVNPFRISTP